MSSTFDRDGFGFILAGNLCIVLAVASVQCWMWLTNSGDSVQAVVAERDEIPEAVLTSEQLPAISRVAEFNRTFARLDEVVKVLQGQRDHLIQVAEENRSTYVRLRNSGADFTVPACRRIVAHERQLRLEIESIDQELEKVQDLRAQLGIAIDEILYSQRRLQFDRSAVRKAQQLLLGSETIGTSVDGVIPDDQWNHGNPDEYMLRECKDF